MARKPNKKQRRWVEEFCKQRPGSRIVSIQDATCGYFYYTIAWNEDLPVYAPSNEEDEELDLGMGWITRQLYVELTPAGIDRLRQETIADIVYPHCLIDWRRRMVTAQTVLPIAQVLELPSEPVKRTTSRRRKKSSLETTQHQLPIDPLGQEILDIRLRQGGEVQSRQDLLSDRAPHYSLAMGTVIHLNQALIDLLKEINATSEEWESAELLLGVIGEAGVLEYIKQIPGWRKYHGIEVASTVPVVAKQSQVQTQSI
ncbi:hypothetical protein VF14_03490 [Nostoc linckia z18]|jgi:hypothetical protein|uniref:Uncharacterized protein n=2 Tax=Nostoc linckia TaxID=92942 RepID=A0A9Q6ENQ6_NOSLI|nr:hypothetical protein [Nostoc linckia]PHK41443.1 hypothetical protein VF12_06470 [Nostoc linckia z15]PHK46944.1 hypothetical protein VF13_08130 [Nostoc linckia z16]PHJ69206.1 hypothetical protein VF02_00960 [Nostoc linckia z1]PHJ73357.1 hypothetical protein VF05_01975 [Nostoc linckia z3]PHJ78704.1 hypothetical protein VF03_00960 [Nostoc linckia z2]